MKVFRLVDLENLGNELNFAVRVYDKVWEAKRLEIKNRKPTHKLVQQAGKPKGYFVIVPIDYPHETATIKTF